MKRMRIGIRTPLVIILAFALLLTGCSSSLVVVTPDSTPTPTPTSGQTYTVTTPDGTTITYVDNIGIPIIPEGFGLQGSVAEFNGVYPGWSGTVPLTIVNGQDKDRLFVLSLRSPSKIQSGYEALPEEYFSWITISQPEVTVRIGEVYPIPITLAMPIDSDYTNKRVEVRILVEDTTQTGLVQIALEAKWFIITAN